MRRNNCKYGECEREIKKIQFSRLGKGSEGEKFIAASRRLNS